MSDNYITLPLGDEAEGEPSQPTAPPLPHAFAPRPPGAPSAPIMGAAGYPAQFEVHVSDPAKQGSGYNAFVSYKVTIKTSLQQYQSPNSCVTRRYNHFVWLHTQLTDQYPCYFVPVLPEKSGITPLFNRFAEEFVEARRIALEQFLWRLVRHPIMCTSKPLQVFFEGAEEVMKIPEEKKPSFFGGLLKDMTSSSTPKTGCPADEEFDAMRMYVKDLEGQLSELHKFLERLVRRRKDLANSLAELGLTLITLGNHEQQTAEEEAETSSKSFRDLGSCCDHLAISIQHQSNDEATRSLMVVDDWLRLVFGAKEALRTRAQAVGQTLNLKTELDRKTKVLASGMQNSKTSVTENDVIEASRLVEESRQRAEMLGERVKEEMKRFKKEKSIELRTMLCTFVSLQLKYESEIQSSWERVLPSLVSGLDPNTL